MEQVREKEQEKEGSPMNIELKPCPFCGSQAKLFITTNGVAVQCRKCSNGTLFRVDRDGGPDALRKVVEDWNRRDEDGQAVCVTRCKDCKYWDDDFRYCRAPRWQLHDEYPVQPSEMFCGWGERRENNGSD